MHEYDIQIRWRNFRSFRDTGWLKIKPITVVIGPNNAGKTSILAPLLLLNQTLTSRDAHRALITRGHLIDAGSYADLIHNHDTDLSLSLTIGFHLHDQDGDEDVEDVGDCPPGALEVAFDYSEENGIQLRMYKVYDVFRRRYFSRRRNPSGTFSLDGLVTMRNMSTEERRRLRKTRPTNFFFSPSSTLVREPHSKTSDGRARRPQEFTSQFSEYLMSINHVHMELCELFFSLSYLGPIRAWPKRYYEILNEDRMTVGPRGEFAAALLHDNHSIQERLDHWIQEFGFGGGIEFSRITGDFFEVGFADAGGHVTNIADAGFGASQLLPLVAQALATDEGEVLVAEQPEIHLNPRLQGTLADLFVEVAQGGGRVVVETHSEHLLLRLRRLVAEGAISPDKVGLYFVEREDGLSSIREVPIRVNGHIAREEWPRGFFEDALRESLALATAQIGAKDA